MERVQRVIRQVEPHDSVERYSALGVECIQGEARVTSPYSVEVNGQTLTSRNIIIATGARPLVPQIPGIEQSGYLTSDTIWGLREKPQRLLVFGGGPIGCELAQAFARLGCKVTIVVRSDRIMKKEDPEIAQLVRQRFESEDIELLLEHQAKEFLLQNGRRSLLCDHHGKRVEIEFDQLLLAAGRAANTDGFGLEELNIALRRNGTIEVDEFMRTSCPTIYACGDVTGPFQFTHTASHQAWYASVNALFGRFRRFRVDYSVIPWCTFTDPEVARVGLNEQEASAQEINYEVTTYGIDDLDRAITDEETHGLIKVLTAPGKDKILGVTIVGEHAGDLLAEYVLAMRHGLGLNKILGTIHIYPTMAEANKYVAGEWKRAHAPQRLLQWVERYHRWMRG
jgi:pyruvate/2-oxoglutarate dehydrogenase complex dihydrolipoamide dehydrogenase (E3) component